MLPISPSLILITLVSRFVLVVADGPDSQRGSGARFVQGVECSCRHSSPRRHDAQQLPSQDAPDDPVHGCLRSPQHRVEIRKVKH